MELNHHVHLLYILKFRALEQFLRVKNVFAGGDFVYIIIKINVIGLFSNRLLKKFTKRSSQKIINRLSADDQHVIQHIRRWWVYGNE